MEKILVITDHDNPVLCRTVLASVHALLHPGCGTDCLRVLPNEAVPDIGDIVKTEMERGVREFLLLSLGAAPDVPVSLARVLKERCPAVKVRTLDARDSLRAIDALKNEVLSPEGIEARSFDLLTQEAPEINLKFSREEQAIIKRVVHSTADFDFVQEILIHPEAISRGIRMVTQGKTILTDIEMVRAGISRKLAGRFGCKILCGLNSHEVPEPAPGQTRTETAVEFMLRHRRDIGMVVVGNAPTALLKTIEVLNRNDIDATPLVVGVPVGFVKALESKLILALQSFPFITNLSRKGGTPVAVAVVNALLRLADEGRS